MGVHEHSGAAGGTHITGDPQLSPQKLQATCTLCHQHCTQPTILLPAPAPAVPPSHGGCHRAVTASRTPDLSLRQVLPLNLSALPAPGGTAKVAAASTGEEAVAESQTTLALALSC